MPPACLRVVPRAEKTVEGRGEREASLAVHWVVSGSMMALSLGPVDLGARREMVWIADGEGDGEERRVVRMWEPTRPVEPKMAVTDMVKMGLVLLC